jgi:hypothetical protein
MRMGGYIAMDALIDGTRREYNEGNNTLRA